MATAQVNKNGKIRYSLIDLRQGWNRWVHRRSNFLCQIWCKSVHGAFSKNPRSKKMFYRVGQKRYWF